MKSEDLKTFELNNSVLKDFDKLMSLHLDYVENLRVSEIDAKSKLLNIISLCINTKTLVIEGDQRVNTNSIVSNICKPELLEKIVINNVKLPSGHTLKKLTGLKEIELKNVRFTNINAFFKGIENPEKIKVIKIEDSDFENNSIKIFEKYKNLDTLSLKNLSNCKLEEISKFVSNVKIKKLDLENLKVNVEEIDGLLKGKSEKNINLEILSSDEYSIKNQFIMENNEKKIVINSNDLENLTNNVNFTKVDLLKIIINEKIDLKNFAKHLKKLKGNIRILVKNTALLEIEDVEFLRDILLIDNIEFLSTDETKVEQTYSIEEFIEIKNELKKYTSEVDTELDEVQRFLKIYKLLSENISVDDNFEEATLPINNLKNCLLEKKCLSNDFAKILQNCLAEIGIESEVIFGRLNKKEINQNWNQVKIDGNWYNVDIALDYTNVKSKNIFIRKAKYCLISDKIFYETHTPISGNKNFAEENFDKKILKVYFKTGIYSDKFFKSYFTNLITKIKLLIKVGTQKALPEGKHSKE